MNVYYIRHQQYCLFLSEWCGCVFCLFVMVPDNIEVGIVRKKIGINRRISDASRLLAVVIMTTANGRHSTFSGRHFKFFDHFRSYIFYHFRSLPISDEVDRLSTKFTEIQWTSVTLTLILRRCLLLSVSSA